METFSDRLLKQVSMSDSSILLENYLKGRSGRHFDTFQTDQNKPNEITPADLLAVCQLSMKIGGYGKRDSISEFAVIKLFEQDVKSKISQSLAMIEPSWRLENISSTDLEKFNASIAEIWQVLKEQVGLKTVARYKLLARKRPNLCPIRDSFSEEALGKPSEWYWSWQEAFSSNQAIIDALENLRSENDGGATHLSLLRIADIVIWERIKTRTEKEVRCV